MPQPAEDNASMKFFLRILLLLVLATPMVGLADAPAQSGRDGRVRAKSHYENLELFGAVYEHLMRNYVDELDPEEVIEHAIDAMLEDLDPHSQLLTEEVYDDLMTSTQGEFGGLGIQIVVRDGYPTVVSPIDGTPAARLGIRGGDQIVEIEGESTEGWKSSEAVKHLRGPKGSKVNIGIRRPGREKILPFTITRDIIKVESVPYAFMLDEDAGVGYVRISNFARTTRSELDDKLSELERDGMKSLIIDLRFNPGGLLSAATDVSELFLDQGDLIVYTQGRLAQQNMSYYASGRGGRKWQHRPLVVLVNGSSASASEILAGAIQDHDLGVVAGQNTFGKGSVQTVFELGPTKALKLTTARYYTPSGRSIHRERTRDGELVDEVDSLAVNHEIEETFTTDGGRRVYGGGGIRPDLEIDPTLLSDFAVALERDALFFHFVNEWLIDHQDPGLEFAVTDEMIERLITIAEGREELPGFFEDMDLEMSRELFLEHRDYLEEGIRREMVRRTHSNADAYRVSIERDGQVQKVVDILRDNPTVEDLFRAAEEMQQARVAELKAREEAEAEEEAAEVN
jgi:carboxyl-terminal processing protease